MHLSVLYESECCGTTKRLVSLALAKPAKGPVCSPRKAGNLQNVAEHPKQSRTTLSAIPVMSKRLKQRRRETVEVALSPRPSRTPTEADRPTTAMSETKQAAQPLPKTTGEC